MKTIAEIKANPKLEIQKQTIDGVAGILHMTGLRKCTFVASWGGGWEHVSVCPENRTPDWDEMCKVELPVPSIEKQRSIVKSYKAITDRIALKKRINDNLAA